MYLTGKVALITGGGRGIGRAVALAYAQVGARLVVTARSQDQLEETAAEVRRFGTEALALPCDVSDLGQVLRLVRETLRVWERIDILVNNAGVSTRPVPLAEVTVEEWDRTMAINLRGPLICSQSVIPLMRRQGGGSIINVSSPTGQGAAPFLGPYAVSKWGLEGFTRTLAAELAPFRIRANAIRPGLIATEMTGHSGLPPESVLAPFLFFAADASSAITGRSVDAHNWQSQL